MPSSSSPEHELHPVRLCFEKRRRTPVSCRPSATACPGPQRWQARLRRIHISRMRVLVHARFHPPSASSIAVTDKTAMAASPSSCCLVIFDPARECLVAFCVGVDPASMEQPRPQRSCLRFSFVRSALGYGSSSL